MRRYFFLFSLLMLFSCSEEKHSTSDSEIASFYKITSVTRNYLDISSRTRKMECGDKAHWSVVKLGKDAVPFLLSKLKSSETTSVKSPCSNQMLTEGGLAFILLDEILNIPYAKVFETQYCVIEPQCTFPSGLLESVMEDPQFYYTKLKRWYWNNEKHYEVVELADTLKTDCQVHYNVTQVVSSK